MREGLVCPVSLERPPKGYYQAGTTQAELFRVQNNRDFQEKREGGADINTD